MYNKIYRIIQLLYFDALIKFKQERKRGRVMGYGQAGSEEEELWCSTSRMLSVVLKSFLDVSTQTTLDL